MPDDPVIRRYVIGFERRWEVSRRQQPHDFRHDFITRLFNEHIVLGKKPPLK